MVAITCVLVSLEDLPGLEHFRPILNVISQAGPFPTGPWDSEHYHRTDCFLNPGWSMLRTLQCLLLAFKMQSTFLAGVVRLPRTCSVDCSHHFSHSPHPRFSASAQQVHCHLLTDHGLSLLLFFLLGEVSLSSPLNGCLSI